jgi:phosphate-selective porin OprO and OprP
MKAPLIAAALLWPGLAAHPATGTTVSDHASGILAGRLAEGTPYERLMSLPVLYKNEAHPRVQQLAVVGQLQTQYASGWDTSGNYGTADTPEDSAWGNIEVRRMRLGMKGLWFHKLFFLNLTELEPDLSPRVYRRIIENYAIWMHSDALHLSAGKCELKFNREQEYSSREFPAFERSAVGNMLYGGELTGAWICGEKIAGGWLYYLGAFSNERRDEWPRFDGGAMILAKAGFDYSDHIDLDFGTLKLQWLHNTKPGYRPSPDDPASPLYSDSFSLSNEIRHGRLGFTTELLWGCGAEGRPDVGALSTTTTWSFTDKLQFIHVMEFAASPDDNGIILPTRYEAYSPGAGDKRGDRWFANYAGLNYHIDGHRLKLMSGVKYSHLHGGSGGGDFNGWTWLAGLRLAF